MSPDEPERRSPGDVVAWRLEAIEKRLDAQATQQARGFADVAKQISGLTFLRTDWLEVYAADQRTANEVHAMLRKELGEVRKDVDGLRVETKTEFERVDGRVNWSWSVLGVALLGAVVTGIARLAGLS